MSAPVNPSLVGTGLRVRAFRCDRGFTVRDLASRAEVSRSTIQRVEAGRSDPNVITMSKIARALAVSLNDFVCAAEPVDVEAAVASLRRELEAWGAGAES